MSMTVFLSCGHAQQLLGPQDIQEGKLPEHGSWSFFPDIEDEPMKPGDKMTCITCMETRTVRSAV